jgi:hypothetical protein
VLIAYTFAQDSDTVRLSELGRLMDATQDLFDDLPVMSMAKGISQASVLHSRIVAFRTSLDPRYDVFEDFDQDLSGVIAGKTTQDTFVQITIYGLYLQLKTLALLPMLQVHTWRALGYCNMGQFDQLDEMSQECVTAAKTTVSWKRPTDTFVWLSLHSTLCRNRSGYLNAISRRFQKPPK